MDDFRRSFATWRNLPCDIFLGAHASYFGMAEKRARMGAERPNPFVDPQGAISAAQCTGAAGEYGAMPCGYCALRLEAC